MVLPLICTANTCGHVDYGIPISAYKSTDYRTSTGTYHRFIPPVSQNFDCRVKVHINKRLLQSDSTLKDEAFKTLYRIAYQTKQGDGNPSGYVPRPIPYNNVTYMRIMQEKLFKQPPPPIDPKVSETKDEYYRKYQSHEDRVVFPPDDHAICEIKALGRDEQRPVRPQEKSYYKYLDPYLTTSRQCYVHYTKDQQDGIARKDIVTYYDASDVPRGGKGYGPRNGPAVEPIFRSKTDVMHDKLKFKIQVPNKIIPKVTKRVPNSGMQSEYRDSFVLQTFSDFYPDLHTTTEHFADALPNATAWQNLAPPAMYCTDFCHLYTGWPVRSVMDENRPVPLIEHDLDLCRPDFVNDSNEIN